MIYRSRSKGLVTIATMEDQHLINALLRSLAREQPRHVTEPLTREIVRRKLIGRAKRTAKERTCSASSSPRR